MIRRQRMRRPPYAERPIPRDLLEQILRGAYKAPSAGYSQGFSFVVLEGEDTRVFWENTGGEGSGPPTYIPALILPLQSKKAYLDRYSEPDKQFTGLGGNEEAWPVPFWTVDTAFATMIVLLGATAAGLACWFFGVFDRERRLLDALGVPSEWELIGAVALGYQAQPDERSPSLKRGRKPFAEHAHYGRW